MAERNASDDEDKSHTPSTPEDDLATALTSSPPLPNHSGYQSTYPRGYAQNNYTHTPNGAVPRPAHPNGAQSHTFLDPQLYYHVPRPPFDPQTGYPQPPFGFWPLAPRPDVIAQRDANLALQQPLPHAHPARTPARNTVADNITTAAPPSSPPHESPEVKAAHILLGMRNSAPIPLSRRGSPVSPEETPTTGSEKKKEDDDDDDDDETELESEDETEDDDDDDDEDYLPK